MPCRERLAQLREHLVHRRQPFERLPDRARRARGAFGFAQGSVSRIYGPCVRRRHSAHLLQHETLGRAVSGDTHQPGGELFDGADGRLGLARPSRHPAGRPAGGEIVSVLALAGGTGASDG